MFDAAQTQKVTPDATTANAAAAQAALQVLNEAWAYYTPEPQPQYRDDAADLVQELFQYHSAA
ncbi:hypothetical protein [Antarcticimicrobium sediminis]|uniref:Uncharacterized protein n=1 Tax=Antarcticimicrobium sediminis TaxID=2546227 RepID=A0A4R5EXE2_9RHOB|nr:hypothetical protein [Antarcticimicrobium sediminis]TDE39623.1 hypothetical protein E1B25_06115 [Antarcticimicrobium sediminis]